MLAPLTLYRDRRRTKSLMGDTGADGLSTVGSLNNSLDSGDSGTFVTPTPVGFGAGSQLQAHIRRGIPSGVHRDGFGDSGQVSVDELTRDVSTVPDPHGGRSRR